MLPQGLLNRHLHVLSPLQDYVRPSMSHTRLVDSEIAGKVRPWKENKHEGRQARRSYTMNSHRIEQIIPKDSALVFTSEFTANSSSEAVNPSSALGLQMFGTAAEGSQISLIQIIGKRTLQLKILAFQVKRKRQLQR